MVSLLKHRIRLDFGAHRTLSSSGIRLFQLFTNGQRQIVQKVDIGNDPKAIFCSFRLRNPDVREDRPEIESNLPGSKTVRLAAANRALSASPHADSLSSQCDPVDVPVSTNPDGACPAFRPFEPGRTIPDLTLRFAFSHVRAAFNTLRFSDGQRADSPAAQCKKAPVVCQPGPSLLCALRRAQ
jgi:hypothetical protein